MSQTTDSDLHEVVSLYSRLKVFKLWIPPLDLGTNWICNLCLFFCHVWTIRPFLSFFTLHPDLDWNKNRKKMKKTIDWALAEARSGPCNQSYCEAGVWGWHEDRSPPRRLLGPLERPHLTYDQFQTPLGGVGWSWGQCGCHRDPLVRPNSNSAEFRASVVLNHSCYVVLGLNWP